MLPRPPGYTLFPYTTLFRSVREPDELRRRAVERRLRVGREDGRQQRCDDERGHGASTVIATGVGHVLLSSSVSAIAPSEIGRAHSELQSRLHLVCRLLLEKK